MDESKKSLNVGVNPESGELFRTDKSERFQNANKKLKQLLMATGSRIFNRPDNTYSPSYIAFHLDLEDEEVPEFLKEYTEKFRPIYEEDNKIIKYELLD